MAKEEERAMLATWPKKDQDIADCLRNFGNSSFNFHQLHIENQSCVRRNARTSG